MSALMISTPNADAMVDAAITYEAQSFDRASAYKLGQDPLRECAESVVDRYRLEASDEARHYETLAAEYGSRRASAAPSSRRRSWSSATPTRRASMTAVQRPTRRPSPDASMKPSR
jgi:hypothetical protein